MIVAVGGVPVTTDVELRSTRSPRARPGTTVDLEVIHQDHHKAIIKTKLGELPEKQAQSELQQIPPQFQQRFQRRQIP